MMYFAAASLFNSPANAATEKQIGVTLRNRLLSYVDIEAARDAFTFWLGDEPPGKRLFLDSGAFSAYSREATIELDEYIAYIHEHAKAIYCYATLDVIGDYKATRANFETMVSAGLHPIGVVHAGSTPLSELDYYCERCEFIALGGMVPLSRQRNELERFLDSAFSVIKKYWPIKVHGFGLTSQWALERYPFYSCDSTAAIMGGGLGRLVYFKNGKLSGSDWKKEARICNEGRLADGLSAGDSRRYFERRLHNICEMMKFEKYVTELWCRRGIDWHDR